MITWMSARWGSAVARRVFIVGGMALAMLLLVILWRCSTPKTAPAVTAQAVQGNKSSEALATAAAAAVDTVVTRAVTEKEIDTATAVALEEIEHAQDPADVRAAVVRAVCMQHAHRNDPACVVR